MVDMENKYCRYCDKTLPKTEFHVRMASKDGLGYKCVTCQRLYNNNRYKENPEAAKKRAAAWANKNMDIRRAIVNKWDMKNIDRKRQRGRDLAKRNREENIEEARLYGRIAAHIRRDRIKGSSGAINKGVAKRILKKAGGVCAYCGIASSALTLDHFHPVSKGGCGQSFNILPCCKSCNSSKGVKDGADWIFDRFGLNGVAALYKRAVIISSARLP